MNVDAILKEKGRRVITMRPNSPLATVIGRMKLEHIGAVILSDDGETIDGILSERDIVRGLANHGGEVAEHSVTELMTRDVRSCGPDDTIADLMAIMTTHRIRHLPVLEDGKLVGIVSIGDAVKYRLDEAKLEVDSLRDYVLAAR